MTTPRKSSWPTLMACGLALLIGGGSAGTVGAGPAWAGGVGTTGGTGRWSWPVGGPDGVLERFDRPPAPWAAGHRGVDLRAGPPTRVHSPAAGVVLYSGVVVDREVLTIDHGNGLVSSFEPVLADVEVGDAVSPGQQVATLGSGGHCSGVCLHWGVRLDGQYLDPLSMLMDLRPSILLPVPAASGQRGHGDRPPA